jgi:hypothetical protein
MFENKELRGVLIFWRGEVTGEWKKLHNALLHNLCCSPNVVRVIKSRRMRWTGHVAFM